MSSEPLSACSSLSGARAGLVGGAGRGDAAGGWARGAAAPRRRRERQRRPPAAAPTRRGAADAHRARQQPAQPEREQQVEPAAAARAASRHQRDRSVSPPSDRRSVATPPGSTSGLGVADMAADVEGDLRVLVAVEAGRRRRLGLEGLVGVGRQHLRAGRRRAEPAEAVERAPRLQRLVDAVARHAARQRHQPLQHVHEQARTAPCCSSRCWPWCGSAPGNPGRASRR